MVQSGQQGVGRMSLHVSPFAPWDRRSKAGMRKEADVFVFLMAGDLLDSGFPLYVAPSGAIMA